MKVAVVYYSFEGNTKNVALKVAKKFGGDVYEIKEVKSNVPKNGFFKYFWGGKQVMTKETPEIEDLNINIDEYDTIFIGTPVWAFTYTPAIRSFLKKYKIQDKKIGIFCCHAGGPKNTLKDLKDALPENEFIGEMEILDPLKNITDSNLKIENWFNDLKI